MQIKALFLGSIKISKVYSVHVPKLKLIHILSEIYDDLCLELKLDILLCSEKNVIVHYFSVIQCAKQHTGFG